MSDKSKSSLAAPAVVIALLVGAYFLYGQFLAPKPVRAPAIAEAPVAEGEMAAAAAPSEPAPAEAIQSNPYDGPLITPVSTVWSTYHGGPELTGYTETPVPEQPELLWRYQAGGPIYYTPVADERGIYACTRSGNVVALDFQGNERWTRQLNRPAAGETPERPERVEAPLSAFLGLVFCGTASGKVYALDAATGEVKWTYDIQGTVLGTATVVPAAEEGGVNQLYVINQDDGVLHCVNALTGEKLWQTEPVERCDGSAGVANGRVVFGSCAAAFHVFDASDGSVQQTIPLDQDAQVAAGAALAGNSIYSGSHNGFFYHADAATGRIYWTNRQSQGEIFSTPAVSPEHVVYSSSDGHVYGLDRRSGMRKWNLEVFATPTSAVIAAERVLVGVKGSLKILELATGKEIWSHEISDEIASPALVEGMIVVGSADGTVSAFGAAAPAAQP